MSEHKLKQGIDFIEAIRVLGKILFYHVEVELPIDAEESETLAVDVAWFKEKNQKFPLFIFEIESTASNGMAFNPMKVFSRTNQAFEKPLFYFQVILNRGQQSSRINILRNQFGTYNYRVYRISTDEKQDLLFDILSQHRRITEDLNIHVLFDFLIKTGWLQIDLKALADHIETLNFEKTNNTILYSYTLLASRYKEFIPICLTYIKNVEKDPLANSHKVNYRNLIGSSYSTPLHLGCIYFHDDDLYIKDRAFRQVKAWQETNSYLSMIGPHFGLSYDYDQFIIWGAGGLLALTSSLFDKPPTLRVYFALDLKKIIEKTRDEFKIPNLIWLMHIAPETVEGEKLYLYAKQTFEKLNRFSSASLLNPPFLNSDDNFIAEFMEHKDLIPSFTEFKTIIKMQVDSLHFTTPDKIQLALYVLTTEEYDDDLNKKIISVLK